MTMAKANAITIEILKQIRDGLSTTHQRLGWIDQALDPSNAPLESVGQRLERVERASAETHRRLGGVETALLELQREQRATALVLREVLGEQAVEPVGGAAELARVEAALDEALRDLHDGDEGVDAFAFLAGLRRR